MFFNMSYAEELEENMIINTIIFFKSRKKNEIRLLFLSIYEQCNLNVLKLNDKITW